MSNPYGYVGGHMGGMNPQMMGSMPMMAPPPPPPSGSDRSGVNPAMNNEPLQFNTSKGKPPMPVSGRGDRHTGSSEDVNDMGLNQGDMDLERADENGLMMRGGSGGMMSGGPEMGGAGSGNGAMMQGGGAAWQNMMGGAANMMMGDPSMMMGGMAPGMEGMGGWNAGMAPGGMTPGGMAPGGMAAMGMGQMPMMMQRDPIQFDCCVLYPPPPNAPRPTTREHGIRGRSADAPMPTTRERPPGCRTVFVGGLPENITEENVREVFGGCGPMTSVRISKKKNFCHIRFIEEYSVDKALQVSGYRMKLGNQDDRQNTGRLHVDYAQARDDLYDWECQQRALAREMRHRHRVEQDRMRPPSPPPVIHFSDHESQVLIERLKGEETFALSSDILITWMDRGDCNRRTSNVFYSMIQSVNSHIRRLTNEKAIYNEEFEKMKIAFRNRLEGLLRQFEQIDKVFKAATRQKAWDHFSKAQRKNIDTWKTQCIEIKQREEQEFLRERKEDEMEMSDSEDAEPSSKKRRSDREKNDVQLMQLREENDNLSCQLEAYKNEVEILKQEQKPAQTYSNDEKDKQIRIFQQTLKGMQQQLMTSKRDLEEREKSLKEKLEAMEYENDKLKKSNSDTLKKLEAAKRKQRKDSENKEKKNGSKEEVSKQEEKEDSGAEVEIVEVPSSSSNAFTDRQARLVGLISTFLHVHPFGASIDYIASYLARLQMKVRTSELEDVLEMCPSVFKLEIVGVGASIEKRWKFIGFNPFS